MNERYFPALDEFYNKFCAAVKRSGNEQRFVEKWGLNTLDDVYGILHNNVQGGYDSHKHTMLSARTGGSVLTIGPGMGFCVFLLSELYDTVFAAEPDEESCSLLKSISKHYPINGNKKAAEKVRIFHAGISITGEAITYWETKQQLLKKRKLKGSILNFNIKGAKELRDIFPEKVSRIYLHKVLSSLSVSAGFEYIISECCLFLKDDGELTWSEPGYIFNDILHVEPQDKMAHTLKQLFGKKNLNLEIKNYQVSERGEQTNIVENWTLLKAWR